MADNPYPDPSKIDFSKLAPGTDLNPTAAQYGMTRDQLAEQRDQWWQKNLSNYRQSQGGNAAEDDMTAIAEMNGQAPMKNGAMQSWTGDGGGQSAQPATPTTPAAGIQNQLVQQMFEQQAAQVPQNETRNDDLYNMLMQRASQGTAINAHDPNIRQQVDPFAAAQERSSRNYLADLAEKEGPYANLRGEQRLAAEHTGQNVGMMQAQVIGNELQSRRSEIQNALSQMGGMLSADQQLALQKQLGILDNAIAQQGLSNNLLGTLLSNQLGNKQLDSNNDQFAAQLGFNTADRSSYWDALRRGLLQ